MPPQATTKIDGIKPLLKKLDRIAGVGSTGRRRAKAIMRKAVRAGAAPYRKAVKQGAPRKGGLLKKSIFIKVKQYPSGVSVAVIGPRVKDKNAKPTTRPRKTPEVDAFYSHMVERGTKPHLMPKPGGKPARMKIAAGQVVSFVRHPGAAPSPYISKASRVSARGATSLFAKKLGDEIRKDALKNG